MVKNDSRIKSLKERIAGLDNASTIAVINALREEPPSKGVVSVLAGIYASCGDNNLCSEIQRFMNDLKDQSLADEVISVIDNCKNEATKIMLLSSCWQSSIDYSGYISHFAGWAYSGSYACTLECFTVIEQFAWAADAGIRKAESDKLSALLPGVTDDRSILLKEIIKILQH